jgi:hypothetical protein
LTPIRPSHAETRFSRTLGRCPVGGVFLNRLLQFGPVGLLDPQILEVPHQTVQIARRDRDLHDGRTRTNHDLAAQHHGLEDRIGPRQGHGRLRRRFRGGRLAGGWILRFDLQDEGQRTVANLVENADHGVYRDLLPHPRRLVHLHDLRPESPFDGERLSQRPPPALIRALHQAFEGGHTLGEFHSARRVARGLWNRADRDLDAAYPRIEGAEGLRLQFGGDVRPVRRQRRIIRVPVQLVVHPLLERLVLQPKREDLTPSEQAADRLLGVDGGRSDLCEQVHVAIFADAGPLVTADPHGRSPASGGRRGGAVVQEHNGACWSASGHQRAPCS